MRKQFSRALYQENDNIAKLAGFYHLINHGAAWVSIHPNDYKCDVVYKMDTIDLDTAPMLLETEVKHTWKGGPFPFPTVNILERKEKYFLEGADILLLSGNKQDYLILDAQSVLESELEEVPNKYVSQMELFYKVPIAKADFYKFSSPINPSIAIACSCYNKSYYIKCITFFCDACGKAKI
jgi:hypothetical protein